MLLLISPCVKCAVPFTTLHKYTYIALMWLLFTNKLWKLVKGFLHSIALPNFVHVSLSIGELHEDVSSHCSLLWYEKRFVYQQNYYNISDKL